jgi:hypothetical protein
MATWGESKRGYFSRLVHGSRAQILVDRIVGTVHAFAAASTQFSGPVAFAVLLQASANTQSLRVWMAV